MDHVRELQGRLFAVVGIFVVFSAISYPFFGKIVDIIVAPLGDDHELVYLTPAGAFSFIIQTCMYVGFITTLPFIIFNVYRFAMPAMRRKTLRKAVGFTISSLLLAFAGMLFAYYVSLPAALYFLTNFNLYHINPMITIDSYFSFVMTYMLAGALLFQIPLIMLMINGMSPQKPGKLMRHQDKIILGSFIVAAIISPTPDALNQTLLASPMIVMYQAGILLIWLRNRRRRKAVPVPEQIIHTAPVSTPPMIGRPVSVMAASTPASHQANQSVSRPVPVRYGIDGFASPNRSRERPLRPALRLDRPTTAGRVAPRSPQLRRSIDGFVVSV